MLKQEVIDVSTELEKGEWHRELRRELNSICFQTILASAFIPVFSGLTPPRYRGLRVIDGGFSDNLPVLDTNTITVSPLAGSAHICPQVHSSSDNTNLYISLVTFALYRSPKVK